MAKFFRRGVTQVHFVPAITDKNAPTVAEITAGDNLSEMVAEIGGFVFSNSPIATPNLAERFTTSIPGEDTAEDSSLTFYEDDTSNPHRVALAKGVEGYIVIFYAGTAGAAPAAGDKCEVWPVISTGPARMFDLGNEAAKWQARFTATATPATDAAIAA